MKKISVVAGLICSLGVSPLAGFDKPENMEGRVLSLEKQTERQEKEVEKNEKNLDKKFENYKGEITNELKKYDNILYIMVGFGGISLISLYVWSKQYIQGKFKELYDKVFDENAEKFEQLIQNHDVEHLLKTTKRILVLSLNVEEQTTIKKFLKQSDLEQLKYLVQDNHFDKKKLTEYDLVIINNAKNTYNDEALKLILSNLHGYKNLAVYYGAYKPMLAHYSNINFANTEFSLYARMMETLKIQFVLLKNKKNG